jgi:hypothetical protein
MEVFPRKGLYVTRNYAPAAFSTEPRLRDALDPVKRQVALLYEDWEGGVVIAEIIGGVEAGYEQVWVRVDEPMFEGETEITWVLVRNTLNKELY